MTTLLDVTPESTEKTEAPVSKTETPVAKTETPAEKPAKPARIKPETARPAPRVAPQEVPAVKWIRLEKGGTYGYKRAIYQQGKTYEVDLATAEHLLKQHYTLGNSNETVDVYYFTEVKRK